MSNTSSSSNRVVVPEAKEAMDKFKMEIADELGAFAGKTGPHQFHLPCEGFFRVTIHALPQTVTEYVTAKNTCIIEKMRL